MKKQATQRERRPIHLNCRRFGFWRGALSDGAWCVHRVQASSRRSLLSVLQYVYLSLNLPAYPPSLSRYYLHSVFVVGHIVLGVTLAVQAGKEGFSFHGPGFVQILYIVLLPAMLYGVAMIADFWVESLPYQVCYAWEIKVWHCARSLCIFFPCWCRLQLRRCFGRCCRSSTPTFRTIRERCIGAYKRLNECLHGPFTKACMPASCSTAAHPANGPFACGYSSCMGV